MGAASSMLGLGDIAVVWSLDDAAGDLVMIDHDPASDRGLETAILLSLFIDAPALQDDQPPSGDPNDTRGWWGDELLDLNGDVIGSRLWLVDRAAIKHEIPHRIELYTREALAWLLTDRVASAVDVVVVQTGPLALELKIDISRPIADPVTYKFQLTWLFQT